MVELRYASIIQIANELLRRSKSDKSGLHLTHDIDQLLIEVAEKLQEIDRISETDRRLELVKSIFRLLSDALAALDRLLNA